jgi:N-methylhydantoinase A/oxoprolinase/acetone carboxylase beta subunit
VILSHGGMAPLEEAARLAAATVLSGPAGGVAGARRCATLLGVPDLIPFDMGGTSTDISLIAGGEASLSAERGLAGERIALRSLDIASIGAGGGSIARADASGTFEVGPESAGAVPGPACYGNGGRFATVTDANLLLGYLDADSFLGGTRKLDRAAAEAAADRVAATLKLSRDQPEDGGRHPPDDAAARRRSPAVRAAELRRRRRPARGGGRARAGDSAGDRADGGLGAVGVGHARHRPALRAQPHAYRRRRHRR